MAIYRCEIKIVGRSDNPMGRSVVACAAYRSGTKLKDEKYDYSPDYRKRVAGVAHSEILVPENAPAFASDRGQLWNAVEAKEDTSTRRKTAQLAREFVIALPHELDTDERRELILGFTRDELVSRGMIADVSIHEPKVGDNHHAHILCTMREVGPEGFGKKVRSWNETECLEGWREAWETHCNAALEKAGLDIRVSRHSLEDQGIERRPEPKIGVAAAALERAGVETENGKAVRHTRRKNQMLAAIRDVVTHGEVSEFPMSGVGETWIERLWNVFEDGVDVVMRAAVNLFRNEASGGWAERERSRRSETEIELG